MTATGLLVFLASCDEPKDSAGACDVQDADWFGVCFGPDPDPYTDTGVWPPANFDRELQVVQVLPTPPSEDCRWNGLVLPGYGGDPADWLVGWSLLAADPEGNTFWFGAELDPMPAIVAGETVYLRVTYERESEWEIPTTSASLTSAEGELLLWVGDADGASGLVAPEGASFRDGDDVCEVPVEEPGCWDAIVVREVVVAYDGEQAVLMQGESAVVGGMIAYLGGSHSDVGNHCEDVTGAYTLVSLAREP